MVEIAPIDPAHPHARYCLHEYFAELDRRFEKGFDPSRSIPADDEEMRPPAGVFVAGVFKPGTYEFTLDKLSVEGEIAYAIWHANCASVDVVLGTDTFSVKDGKIAVQTFAAKIVPH
jgi:hypothetical protein